MLNESNSRPSTWDNMRRPGWKKPRQRVQPGQRAAWVAHDRGSTQPGSRNLGHLLPGLHMTWVKKTQAARHLGRVRPRPRTACVSLFWVLGSSSFSFIFIFFFSGFSLICSGFFSIFIRVVNQVLETRFPCGRHVEKYATLAWKEFESKRLNL